MNKANRMERAKSVGASASNDDHLTPDAAWRHRGNLSAVSSDAEHGDHSDLDSERTNEITRISAELRSKVDAMARSINHDRGAGAADHRALVNILFTKLTSNYYIVFY